MIFGEIEAKKIASEIFWPLRDYCPNSYTVAWDEQAQTCYILHDFQKLMNDEEFSV